MEFFETGGRMQKRCCCSYKKGKVRTENQLSARIRKHSHGGNTNPALKLRWNKKKGRLEKSKKGSKISKWLFSSVGGLGYGRN